MVNEQSAQMPHERLAMKAWGCIRARTQMMIDTYIAEALQDIRKAGVGLIGYRPLARIKT